MARKKAEFDPRKLEIRQTPDIIREPAKRNGASHNLSVSQFIWNLLVLNESLPRAKKMTDAEIARQVVVEFRKYPTTVRYYSKNRHAIGEYRMRYMRGNLSIETGIPPATISYRYNKNGQRIHRARVMSDKEDYEYRLHWTCRWYDKMDEYPRIWMVPKDDPNLLEARREFVVFSEKMKNLRMTRRRRNIHGDE